MASPATSSGRLQATCDALAEFLEYPSGDFQLALSERAKLACAIDGAGSKQLDSFLDYARSQSVSDLQEMYTRTFDHCEDCALEIGWHLYGETYQRGVFMVQMRELLRHTSVTESTELPDHLSQVLRALGVAAPRDARVLIKIALLPAVMKIAGALLAKKSPYTDLLQAVEAILTAELNGNGARNE